MDGSSEPRRTNGAAKPSQAGIPKPPRRVEWLTSTDNVKGGKQRGVWLVGNGSHSDGAGLALIVRNAGQDNETRAWVFRYAGDRVVGLGSLRKVDLLAARAKRRTLQARVDAAMAAGAVIDLAAEKRRGYALTKAARAARVAARKDGRVVPSAVPSIRTLLAAGRDVHTKVILVENTNAKSNAQWLTRLNKIPDALRLHRDISTITAGELADALRPVIAQNHDTGKKLAQQLGRIYREERLHDKTLQNPMPDVTQALKSLLKKAPKQKPHRHLKDYSEVRQLHADMRAAAGPSALALRFLLLTAARTNEVIAATWDEIDMAARTWLVPADKMKARSEHLVYLNDAAMAVLTQAGGSGSAGEVVFKSPVGGGRLSDAALAELMKRTPVSGGSGYWWGRTTAAGLRKSFSTWANETGAARSDVIEASLAHTEGDKVRGAYNMATYAGERRALMDAWGVYCTGGSVMLLPEMAVVHDVQPHKRHNERPAAL